jgi:hypothetical protein
MDKVQINNSVYNFIIFRFCNAVITDVLHTQSLVLTKYKNIRRNKSNVKTVKFVMLVAMK